MKLGIFMIVLGLLLVVGAIVAMVLVGVSVPGVRYAALFVKPVGVFILVRGIKSVRENRFY